MIRYKKIRGHKRIWKDIDFWVENNKVLDVAYLQQREREYVKVWVAPFSNISVLNSEFSPPKGKTRKKIVAGIFTIYRHWKKQLEALKEPYYLKIWYFPHDVSKCQVVCALGACLDFYDKTFYKPKNTKPFPEDVKGLDWEYRHQEHHITKDDIGEPDEFYTYKDYIDRKKWVEGIMKNPKTRISTYPNDDITPTYYSIKEWDVWIGGD
ncbi:hypothetical protein [Polaribacter sp.]|uniref:hypothetical protein n=1 Tax=Polaribacter sp. TaxID=1920175 RepID=UPI003F6BB845